MLWVRTRTRARTRTGTPTRTRTRTLPLPLPLPLPLTLTKVAAWRDGGPTAPSAPRGTDPLSWAEPPTTWREAHYLWQVTPSPNPHPHTIPHPNPNPGALPVAGDP